MACLFACFSISKPKRRRLFNKGASSLRRGDRKALLQAKKLENQEHVEKSGNTIATPEVKLEEQRVKCSAESKYLFEELDIKTVSDEVIDKNGGKEDEKSDEEKQRSRVVLESSERKGNRVEPESNDRSQSCSRTGDSLKDLALDGFEEADNSDEEKEKKFVIEETSESLFSLSIDSRKRVSEVDFVSEIEVTSPISKKANVQDQVVEFVLNPIENVIARKTIKEKKDKLQEDQDKENIVELETRCQVLMPDLSSKKKIADKEIDVDTSLSSWLVESGGTNSAENSDSKERISPSGKKGRPVLEELNLQEPRPEFVYLSKSNTRDQDSDDVPLIGTIGSYLSCTNQTRNRMITI